MRVVFPPCLMFITGIFCFVPTVPGLLGQHWLVELIWRFQLVSEEQFQIVPDFEPEIENSIAESLSDISETVEEHIADKVTKLTSKVKTMKVPSFSLIFAFVAVFSLFVFIGYSKYTNSTNYQNKKALEAIQKQDYYQAAQIYENIKKNPKFDKNNLRHK